jgi:hypothetical protein
MSNRIITNIQIRRGSEEKRKQIIFEDGELVYIIDRKKVFVGNNLEIGGFSSSTRQEISQTDDIPSNIYENDLFVNKKKLNGFIVDNEMNKIDIIPSMMDCCDKIQKDIDNINEILKKVENECCNQDLFLGSDGDDLIPTDRNSFIKVKNYTGS